MTGGIEGLAEQKVGRQASLIFARLTASFAGVLLIGFTASSGGGA
jgi:hypothetical protein